MSVDDSAPRRPGMMSEFWTALARAQAEFPPIPRSKTVTVRTQAGQKYTFDYAPLEDILRACRPALAKHGLSITQDVGATPDGKVGLTTTLGHSSGDSRSSYLPLTFPTRPQELGSLLTYARRYAIVAMLGVAAEDTDEAGSDADDDGNAAEGNEANVAPKADTRPRPAPGKTVEEMSLPEQVYTLASSTGMETRDAIVRWAADNVGHPLEHTNPRTGEVVHSLLALTSKEAERLVAKLRSMQKKGVSK